MVKIFLSVGSQMPFDRMVLAVYEWFTQLPSGPNNLQVVAQVGQTALTLAEVKGWKTHAVLAEHEFHNYCRWADLIVGHAGMGLVFTALDFGRPMLLMPRQCQKRETRNDHQLSTARWLQNQKGVVIAWEENELKQKIEEYKLVLKVGSDELCASARSVASRHDKTDLLLYLESRWMNDAI